MSSAMALAVIFSRKGFRSSGPGEFFFASVALRPIQVFSTEICLKAKEVSSLRYDGAGTSTIRICFRLIKNAAS